MNFDRCASCGTISPEGEYCPNCGKAMRKWCPGCGAWKAAHYTALEVDDSSGDAPVLLGEFQLEAKFCRDCGRELQTKGAPHE